MVRVVISTGLILFALLLFSVSALAHRPLSIGGVYEDATEALWVRDLTISQVIYCELTERTHAVWLTFEAQAGEVLSFSLGVPVIERVGEFRPAMAVLGPDFPPAELPIPTPGGVGGQIFSTNNVENPEFFHEPFTGTDSWVLLREEISLPASGRYYLVAFSTTGEMGKLWVAVGEREAFSLSDVIHLPAIIADVRQFHEVSDLPSWLGVAMIVGFVLIGLVIGWVILR